MPSLFVYTHTIYFITQTQAPRRAIITNSTDTHSDTQAQRLDPGIIQFDQSLDQVDQSWPRLTEFDPVLPRAHAPAPAAFHCLTQPNPVQSSMHVIWNDRSTYTLHPSKQPAVTEGNPPGMRQHKWATQVGAIRNNAVKHHHPPPRG